MTECLIVGGGVYGAAVAFELAVRGASVRLIEARHIASGASGGPGRRGVRANYRDHRELPLMARAHALWPGLHERLGTAALFERTGHLLLVERPMDLAEAEARVAIQKRLGTPSRLLSRAELRELAPGLAPAVEAAVYCPEDGVADHGATTRAYAAAAKAAGAVIDEGVTALRLLSGDDRIGAVETHQGDEIEVPGQVLLLANGGVRKLLRPWLELPTWNLAYQVLLSRPLADNPVRHLVGHAHRTLSLKREPDGRLMISGGRPGRWDPVRRRGAAIPTEIAANLADAVAVYPALEDLEIELADAGHLESNSIDGIPVIDRPPGLANVIFASGWSGHGWAIAPAVARLLADWTLEGERPALLAPFALRRFG
jgi:sarcosine oxidase subunit beta